MKRHFDNEMGRDGVRVCWGRMEPADGCNKWSMTSRRRQGAGTTRSTDHRCGTGPDATRRGRRLPRKGVRLSEGTTASRLSAGKRSPTKVESQYGITRCGESKPVGGAGGSGTYNTLDLECVAGNRYFPSHVATARNPGSTRWDKGPGNGAPVGAATKRRIGLRPLNVRDEAPTMGTAVSFPSAVFTAQSAARAACAETRTRKAMLPRFRIVCGIVPCVHGVAPLKRPVLF